MNDSQDKDSNKVNQAQVIESFDFYLKINCANNLFKFFT